MHKFAALSLRIEQYLSEETATTATTTDTANIKKMFNFHLPTLVKMKTKYLRKVK